MKRLSLTFIPPITIDNNKKGPIYGQLDDWFRTAITEGRMKPGHGLPSTRSMARELELTQV
jgi:GntR family transcriptional regulator / MocR family aminotransferase